MIKELQSYFYRTFQEKPIIVRAPGRVNIIGEHTDYNKGLVLPFAIEQSIYFALSSRDDGIMNIHALDLDEKVSFSIQGNLPNLKWMRYFNSAIDLLRDRLGQKGANIAIRASLPGSSGISSSSALTCGFIFGINHIHQMGMDIDTIIQLSSLAENGTGPQGGLMDQTSICVSEKGCAVHIDCLTNNREYIPLSMVGSKWKLLVSGVQHNMAESEYNVRRNTCERALRKIQMERPNVETLRDVSLTDLTIFKGLLSRTEFNRIKHVVEENARVEKAGQHLKKHEIKEIGKLLIESHESLKNLYEVSCVEIDFIVERLEENSDCHGARIMGGGFGGSVIALFKDVELDFLALKKQYFDKFGLELVILNIESANGIEIINNNLEYVHI